MLYHIYSHTTTRFDSTYNLTACNFAKNYLVLYYTLLTFQTFLKYFKFSFKIFLDFRKSFFRERHHWLLFYI